MLSTRRFKIAILDSGAGGLSIVKEIQSRRINADQVYIADKKCFPYGLLNDSVLLERVIYLVSKTISLHQPDLVILACNTASTVALPSLRAKWDIPFIGVVPAIKPAAEQSKSKEIALLATPATVKRRYLQELIDVHAPEANVYCHGSSNLVELCERYILNQTLDHALLNDEIELALSKSKKIDSLVLACTHFPLIKPQIENIVYRRNIKVIDSSTAIVNRLITISASRDEITRNEISSGFEKLNLIIENTEEGKLEAYKAFLSNPDYKIHLGEGF